MGDLGNEDRLDQYWSLKDLRARYGERFTLTDLAERSGGPARYVRIEETGQKIGFITPLTHNFCESCNRVRLTCTGELYMCLGQEDMADLRAPLRASADNALQIHGGNGFALEYKISRILCDARILNIFEGAAEIQAQVIARRLLG